MNIQSTISDSEAIEIIKKFQSGGYDNDDENTNMIDYIERFYPDIIDLIYHDNRDLSAEEILKEAKEKCKPILL